MNDDQENQNIPNYIFTIHTCTYIVKL